MKRRRGCITWAVVALCSVGGLALLVLCPLGLLYNRRLDQARAAYAPPTVYITEPTAGTSARAGSYVPVAATAAGFHSITRTELWVDGELVETQDSTEPAGISPFDARFHLLLTEGPHLLFVRAVNAAGISGQSAPVGIIGTPKPGPGGTFLTVAVEEGQTLADVATSYETDPQTLQDLNPGLGEQGPAPGSLVTVPAPPETKVAEEAPPPAVVSTPAPVPMPDTPPLQPIHPSPSITGTAPPPITVGPTLPKLAIPISAPPAAPTDLQGYVDKCKVRLRWKDNAWNETSYDLWMASVSGSAQLLASLQPARGGAAWVEFAAPQPGKLSFWVEAVNSVGKQPSNIIQVQVDQQCPSTAPTQLRVDVLDMTVRGNYDRAYCYVSFENLPELRMPADDSAFVRVEEGGRGDTAALATGGRKLVIAIPADKSLDITAECWGWSGADLNKLGSLSGRYPAETWDGARRALDGETVQLGIALITLGAAGATGGQTTYAYEDPSLPVPYDVTEDRVGSDYAVDPYEQWEWSWQRELSWKWSGDVNKITGFVIYLDGKPYKSVASSSRAAVVTLPTWCWPGWYLQWQVAAVAGTTQSRLSEPISSGLPQCPMQAMVEFDWVHFRCIDDGEWGDCDEAEGYFDLGLDMVSANYYGGTSFARFRSFQKFYFAGIPQWATKGSPTGRFIVPIHPKQDGSFCFSVNAGFYDLDDLSDDILSLHQDWYCYHNRLEAVNKLGCGTTFYSFCMSRLGGGRLGDATSDLQYRLTIFPNKCSQYPPSS